MTPKERILETLNRRTSDRVAWSPLIAGYFLLAQKKEIRDMGIIEMCKKLNIDIIAKTTASAAISISKNVLTKTFINDKEVSNPEEEHNWQLEARDIFEIPGYRSPQIKTITKRFETPIGILTSSYMYNISAKTIFQKEYYIKKKEDIKILKFMYNDLEYLPTYSNIADEEAKIAEDGIVAAGIEGSPIIEMIENFIGVQNFLFYLYDYKEDIESLYEVMLAKNIEALEIIARSPAKLIVVWEDTGTGLYSPGIFKKYIAPVLKKYSDIAHNNNKCILVHSCGLLKDIIMDLVETGIDGLTDVSPLPTANIDLIDIRKKVGRDFILTGGIDPTVITGPDKKVIEKNVIKLINDMKPYGNFILGSADSVPADTPLENLELIYRIVEDHGYY